MKNYESAPDAFTNYSYSQVIQTGFKYYIGLWAGALLLVFAGTAYADHTTEHDVQNLKGGLGAIEQRLWDCENGVGGACPGTTGPEGPQGPQGETGPIGLTGATGADGATGPQGIQGQTGNVGATGVVGPQGPTGPQGPAGTDGTDGLAGAPGADGVDGTDGTDGTNGIDGVNGDDGLPGPPGVDAAGPIVETRSPELFDDINGGYSVGTIWVDTIGGAAYIMIDNAPGIAIWKQLTPPATYQVGDEGPAGGTVFYITDGGLHGLEAAPTDSPSAPWGCFGSDIIGAADTAIGTGQQNTADILADCPESPIAADVASTTINGVLGWFLPSRGELNELYLNRGVVGGFASNFYWSSSEFSGYNAWLQGFVNGVQYFSDKGFADGVRAVRAF